MLHLSIFYGVLFTVCGYALTRGGPPERAVSITMLTGVVATLATLSALPVRYRTLEMPTLVIDVLVLAAFVVIAMKADRRWPLGVAALHAMSVGAHLVKALDPELIRTVYKIMTAAWIYPQLLLLAIGVWRHRRRMERDGADPSWSVSSNRSQERRRKDRRTA